MIDKTYHYRPNRENRVSAGFDPATGVVDVQFKTYGGELEFSTSKEDLDSIIHVLSKAREGFDAVGVAEDDA